MGANFIIGCSIILCFLAVCAFGLIILHFHFKPIPESNATYKEYSSSDYAGWIVIPESSSSIDTFSFFGFDTNYRFVKTIIKDDNIDLKLLAGKSLVKQPREVYKGNYTEINDFKIKLLDFHQVFSNANGTEPVWWNKELNQFDHSYTCFWDGGGYGYGYMYLLDTQNNELRVFQWSQQWNTVRNNKNLFRNLH